MSIIINTEEVTTKSLQFISFNCEIIRIPTSIKAEVVTGILNRDRINGEMKTDNINNIPITTDVKPVLSFNKSSYRLLISYTSDFSARKRHA